MCITTVAHMTRNLPAAQVLNDNTQLNGAAQFCPRVAVIGNRSHRVTLPEDFRSQLNWIPRVGSSTQHTTKSPEGGVELLFFTNLRQGHIIKYFD